LYISYNYIEIIYIYMSGKYFIKKNGIDVDLTELFQPDGTDNNTYYPDLDISNTKKEDNAPFARPDEFGYKIKDANGTITDLSEYCIINPTYFADSSNVDVTNCNFISGYIVGGSGGGGGGSGGAYDTTWGGDDHNGAPGGAGGAGEVKWFADISLNGVNNINITLGNKGGGGIGGNRYRGSGGWSEDGGNGNIGNESVIYKGDTKNTDNELVKSSGGNGGNKGNRVSTGASGGNSGTAGNCGGHGTTHQEHNNTSNFTTANWSSNYSYLPVHSSRTNIGTSGGGGGGAGSYNNNNANGGNPGGAGAKGYAVLYLKR
jgi:hypothetical protein